MISPAAQSVWAKSDRDTGDSMSLWRHMQDSAAVAGKLWDEWLAVAVKVRIQESCGASDSQEARTLLTWLAATHDAGKAHEKFSYQVPSLADGMRSYGLDSPWTLTPQEKLPHSVLSYTIINRWLREVQGFDAITAASYSTIAGGHHGVPPSTVGIRAAREATEALAPAWHEVQNELMAACASLTGADSYFPSWKAQKLTPQAQLLLTAVVIVADWIASNVDLFPYGDQSTTGERLSKAWEQLDLAPPWAAPVPPEDPEKLFAGRFDLPQGARPTDMQRKAIEAAFAMEIPGVLIIEAPMGVGKTEAALAAAEVFAAKWGLGGVVFALPTQATSDAMFTRFPSWVSKLPDARPGLHKRSIYLAHSKSLLNEKFRKFFRESTVASGSGERIHGVFGEESGTSEGQVHAAIAHQWLFGRKKGLLASFVVATVDQVLFAALQSKHVVLRHLALAGKVVIIDEVHAYDAFMNRYLNQVLAWLASYGVPVILLSATLPAATRRQLVESYESGRITSRAAAQSPDWNARPRRRRPGPPSSSPLDGNPGYPLLVSSAPGGPRLLFPAAREGSQPVTLKPLGDDPSELLAALELVKRDGGCVAIICNTVQRAQGVFKNLSGMFADEELMLVHSRFMAPDRMRLEEQIRSVLGRDDVVAAAGKVRPERLVVVGTQVLEQSLDVDFDLMITDIAPTDLLLQRIGRLHRRQTVAQPRPKHLQAPSCLVRGVLDWTSSPPVFEAGSVAIYGRAMLMRSYATLESRFAGGTPLELPADISSLVQQTYADGFSVPEAWGEAFDEAEKERSDVLARKFDEAGVFLLKGAAEFPEGLVTDLLDRNVGNADDGVQEAVGLAKVRDTDESLEVILACKTSEVTFVPHLARFGGMVIPTDSPPEDRTARALSTCTVRLPPNFCRPRRIDKVLNELESLGIAAWQKSSWLKGQLVLFLDEAMTAELDGTRLRYDPRIGLYEEKEETE
ncbi:CRISPR-associated helicase Cas3' [Arthrobacter sp. RAF14]|uniref:CRISPR-associated helicase Cas3' n=1 Tax=Arthrobacter sp. RAF14 TaxID=3233051 RepID=UPI003F927F21